MEKEDGRATARDMLEGLRLLRECSDDLAAEIEARYAGMKDHPAMKRRYDRDMSIVLKARAHLVSPGQ